MGILTRAAFQQFFIDWLANLGGIIHVGLFQEPVVPPPGGQQPTFTEANFTGYGRAGVNVATAAKHDQADGSTMRAVTAVWEASLPSALNVLYGFFIISGSSPFPILVWGSFDTPLAVGAGLYTSVNVLIGLGFENAG